MWAGYTFSSDLESWAIEVADAALDLTGSTRESFLRTACDGADRLLARVRELLLQPWREPESAASGLCAPGEIRIVALKIITSDASGVAHEAATVAKLHHPNIVTVHDADLTGPRPCLVMEFVEGISLRAWIDGRMRQAEPPPAATTRTIVRQTAAALAAAHKCGLVHCDVKPENILLVKNGADYIVRVADFGIARRSGTMAGPVIGTPGYVAPEQFERSRPDPRSDIFALGTILYELLAGVHPFVGPSVAETYYNTLSRPAVLPGNVDGSLRAVARRALEKRPQDRYQTAEEFIADLDFGVGAAVGVELNPLLSEFPMGARRWWSHHSAGALLALVSSAWGLVSLAVSVAVGTACVRVLWASSAAPHDTAEMLFGYAIEPNAGLWYLVGTSLCLLVGCWFLEAAFRAIGRTQALSVIGEGSPDSMTRIAALNRSIFRVVTPAIVVAATAFVAVPELAFRHGHAFGWVQADLSQEVAGASYESLRQAGKIGELPMVAALCPNCPVIVAAVANGRPALTPPPSLAFAVFLGVALFHQVILATFLLWIGAKVLFYFWLLSTALLGGGRHGLRLNPDFRDEEDYRFGLGRLDNVYYAILVLVVLGSIGLGLQAIANISKGTYLLVGDPAPALFGQAVLLLGTLAALTVVLATPVAVFVFLTMRSVDEELGRLSRQRRDAEARLAAAHTAADRERVHFELETIAKYRTAARKQSLLPWRQPLFLTLLAACLATLLVLPVTVQRYRDSAPRGVAARSLSSTVCELVGNPRPRH